MFFSTVKNKSTIFVYHFFKVEEYVKELNALESRRGRRPLDVNNVIYWFKNTRAAVKRAEMKARVTTTSMTSTLTSASGCEKVPNSGNIFGSSPPSAHNSLWPWFHNTRTRFIKHNGLEKFKLSRPKNS